MIEQKQKIQDIIQKFEPTNLGKSTLNFFDVLGYSSEIELGYDKQDILGIMNERCKNDSLRIQKRVLFDSWETARFLFQYTLNEVLQITDVFTRKKYNPEEYESYIFCAIRLDKKNFSNTKLATITREINRLFMAPVMILFSYGEFLTLSIINRRPNKQDIEKDVVGIKKVALIKDIFIHCPHHAHIEILSDLSVYNLTKRFPIQNFVDLHNAWQNVLSVKELGKRFYRELSDWYFWALTEVKFPHNKNKVEKEEINNTSNTILLLTRFIFCWFLKEKKLIPDDIFNEEYLEKQIKDFNIEKSKLYYKAILQNLFFTTLNLKRNKQTIIDGFYTISSKQPIIPDSLFFGKERLLDLTDIYGDKKHKKKKVRGLIHILNSYKFTIVENTPIEEEVALDPELLGKVFENLLASYNSETKTTARKQTGSFYTPREIVNYMVDESLIAYLCKALPFGVGLGEVSEVNQRLRQLFSYSEDRNPFNEEETSILIQAIYKCKILDPACGSGAFLMGVLNRMVGILKKLDPANSLLEKIQEQKKIEFPKAFTRHLPDYARKLHLIENCIYGVEIQPIAVWISKLRFFISLVSEQKLDENEPNLGISSLPNLETKFVAANALIDIDPQEKFDIVIGNPPYVESRNSNISDKTKIIYQNNMKNQWGDLSNFITKGADLLIYFFATSIFLMKDEGIVTLITQNSWLDTDYGKKFQKFLTSTVERIEIIDYDRKSFDSANINTIITIFSGKSSHAYTKNLLIKKISFGKKKVSIEKTRYLDIVNDKKANEFKWGLYLSGGEVFFKLLDILTTRGKYIKEISKKSSFGQGLNLEKKYIIPFTLIQKLNVKNYIYPILTVEDGAPFFIQSTKRYLMDVKANKEIKRKINSEGYIEFDPNTTKKNFPDLILPRGIGRHFCSYSINTFSSSCVELYIPDIEDKEKIILTLWTILNSSIEWIVREIAGRKNLGGGMLKAEATDLNSFPIFFDLQGWDKIKKLFAGLKNKETISPLEELYTPHHQEFDKIVFESIGIMQEDREKLLKLLHEKILERQKKSKT